MQLGPHRAPVAGACLLSGVEAGLVVVGAGAELIIWRAELQSQLGPLHSWSRGQVSAWLEKAGFGQFVSQFRQTDGQQLAGLDQAGLAERGVGELHRASLLQAIQQARMCPAPSHAPSHASAPPDEFLCPITCDIMTNPVRAADG